MTAQMNHINHSTLIEDRPTDTTVGRAAPVTSTPTPTTPNGRRGPRWIGPLVAVGAIVAVGAVLVNDANNDPSPVSSQEVASIDAIRTYWETRSFPIEDADQEAGDAAASVPFDTPGSINDPFRRSQNVPATGATPTVLDRSIVAIEHATSQPSVLDRSIVAVDHAASQATESATTDLTTAQRLVQEAIDQALADQAGAASSESFDRAEANRMNTLQELSATANTLP